MTVVYAQDFSGVLYRLTGGPDGGGVALAGTWRGLPCMWVAEAAVCVEYPGRDRLHYVQASPGSYTYAGYCRDLVHVQAPAWD